MRKIFSILLVLACMSLNLYGGIGDLTTSDVASGFGSLAVDYFIAFVVIVVVGWVINLFRKKK